MNFFAKTKTKISSAYNLPNYREKYFEHNSLDKIHGQLAIDSIVKILRKVKLNAQRVPTTLDGGQLGYLVLVINTATYNSTPGLENFN